MALDNVTTTVFGKAFSICTPLRAPYYGFALSGGKMLISVHFTFLARKGYHFFSKMKITNIIYELLYMVRMKDTNSGIDL